MTALGWLLLNNYAIAKSNVYMTIEIDNYAITASK
jgi:hypothetical protein